MEFRDSVLIELGRRLDNYPVPLSHCTCGGNCDIAYVQQCACECEPDFDNWTCLICKKAYKPVRDLHE